MSNNKWKMIFLLFNNPQQMGPIGNRPAHRQRVRTLDNLIQLAQAQTADDLFLISRTRNRTAVILNPNLRRGGVLIGLFLRSHTTKVPQPVSHASARLQKDLSF